MRNFGSFPLVVDLFPTVLTAISQAAALWVSEATIAIGYPEPGKHGTYSKLPLAAAKDLALLTVRSRHLDVPQQDWFNHRQLRPASFEY